jgi:hypothetical protein
MSAACARAASAAPVRGLDTSSATAAKAGASVDGDARLQKLVASGGRACSVAVRTMRSLPLARTSLSIKAAMRVTLALRSIVDSSAPNAAARRVASIAAVRSLRHASEWNARCSSDARTCSLQATQKVVDLSTDDRHARPGSQRSRRTACTLSRRDQHFGRDLNVCQRGSRNKLRCASTRCNLQILL